MGSRGNQPDVSETRGALGQGAVAEPPPSGGSFGPGGGQPDGDVTIVTYNSSSWRSLRDWQTSGDAADVVLAQEVRTIAQ